MKCINYVMSFASNQVKLFQVSNTLNHSQSLSQPFSQSLSYSLSQPLSQPLSLILYKRRSKRRNYHRQKRRTLRRTRWRTPRRNPAAVRPPAPRTQAYSPRSHVKSSLSKRRTPLQFDLLSPHAQAISHYDISL